MDERDPVDVVDALYDRECGLDANFQHLRHWTEGYIAAVRGVPDPPYSPGSAREVSWSMGVEQATRDRKASMTQDEILHLLECCEAQEEVTATQAWDMGAGECTPYHSARAKVLRKAIATIKAAGPRLELAADGYPVVMARW